MQTRRGFFGMVAGLAGVLGFGLTTSKAKAAPTSAPPSNDGSELIHNGVAMRFCRTKSLSWLPIRLLPSMEPMPSVVTVDVEGIINLGPKQSLNDVRTALTTPRRPGSYRYKGQLVAESAAVVPEAVSVLEIHGDRCVFVRWRGRFEA